MLRNVRFLVRRIACAALVTIGGILPVAGGAILGIDDGNTQERGARGGRGRAHASMDLDAATDSAPDHRASDAPSGLDSGDGTARDSAEDSTAVDSSPLE